jgi:hypothetical protein
MGTRWTEDPMDVDDTEDGDISKENEDDKNNSEEVRTLKVSRFFLLLEELGSSFVSVSGSSKIFEESPTIG